MRTSRDQTEESASSKSSRPLDEDPSPALKTIFSLLLSPLPSVIPQARQDPPPYEVHDISGKGKGLIATRKILRGQVFMVYYAAVIIDAQLPNKVKRD